MGKFSRYGAKKILAGLVGLSIILVMLIALPQKASAEESAALTVKGNGVEREVQFTISELEAMQVTNNYSGYNHWPSLQIFKNAAGPTIKSILEAAGLKDDATLIRIKGDSGGYIDLTRKQLLDTPRYYFPDGENTSDLGEWPPNRTEEGKVPVEAMIALNVSSGKLLYGQETPLEPTACNGQLISQLIPGCTIEVTTDPLEQWGEVETDTPPGTVVPGTKVTLLHVYGEPDNIMIYYTLDGSEPTIKSNIFNISYPNFQPQLNAPIPIDHDVTVKTRTIGMGKLDGEVSTYQYYLGKLACTIEGSGLSKPVSFAVENLKEMPSFQESYQCSENGEPVTLAGKGVLLSTLLDQLNISNLWKVEFISVNGEEYAAGTVQELKDQQCLLAYEVNGEEVADVSGDKTVPIQILLNRNSGDLADNRLKYVNAIRLIDVNDEITIKNNVKLMDHTGQTITAVAPGGGYCINAQLTNNVNAPKDVLMIIQVRNGEGAAVTTGGRIVGCAAVQTVIGISGGKATAEFTLPGDLNGKAYVDVFVWDNCNNQRPLGKDSNVLSFDIE